MDNPEKLETLGTQDKDKQNKNIDINADVTVISDISWRSVV